MVFQGCVLKSQYFQPLIAYIFVPKHSNVQFNSVTQSCLTLCNPMDSSTPGFPVNHQLPELAQTNVHQVGDAIFWWCQPSHPLSSPPPPVFSLSQHQGLFPMSQFFVLDSASASVLPMNIQDWFPLGLTDLISLLSKGLSRVFSNTTVQNINSSTLIFMAQLSHPYMTTGKTIALIG